MNNTTPQTVSRRVSPTARLKDEIAELRLQRKEIRDELNALRRYLTSEKFHVDPTVQVSDVLNRLPITYPD